MSKKLKKLASIFNALSDVNRLKILELVYKKNLKCKLNKIKKCTGENCTCLTELEKKLKIGMPTISHHVKELVNAELILTQKNGRWLYLKINPKKFTEVVNFLQGMRIQSTYPHIISNT